MTARRTGMNMTAANRGSHPPLPTLLSQLLVAFTVELDNEFERRMGKSRVSGGAVVVGRVG